MLEILQFIFSSPWVFFGFAWLLLILRGTVGDVWRNLLIALARGKR